MKISCSLTEQEIFPKEVIELITLTTVSFSRDYNKIWCRGWVTQPSFYTNYCHKGMGTTPLNPLRKGAYRADARPAPAKTVEIIVVVVWC